MRKDWSGQIPEIIREALPRDELFDHRSLAAVISTPLVNNTQYRGTTAAYLVADNSLSKPLDESRYHFGVLPFVYEASDDIL